MIYNNVIILKQFLKMNKIIYNYNYIENYKKIKL